MFRNILLVLLMAFSFNAVAQNKTNPCDNIPVATKDMTQNEVSTLLEACRGKAASGVAAIADTVTPEKMLVVLAKLLRVSLRLSVSLQKN